MLRRASSGFVLLEAAVALVVIGLAAAAALELFASHLRAASRGPRLLTAAALAQDRLAAVRLLDAGQLRRVPDSLARGSFSAPFGGYRWSANSSRTGGPNVYEVGITISWLDGSYALVSRVAAAPPTARVDATRRTGLTRGGRR